MNFPSILKRKTLVDRALVNIEHDLDDLFKNEYLIAEAAGELRELADGTELEPIFGVPGIIEEFSGESPAEDFVVDGEDAEAKSAKIERITSHTRNRLAAFAMYESTRTATFDEVTQIGSSLAKIVASHHLGREFLNDCFSDIHRANELEVANAALIAENRTLAQRVDNLEKLRLRFDTLVEMLKKRENKLRQERDAIGDALDALKFEMVDARNLISSVEAKHGELHSALLAKTSQAEYASRETELLREKNANLTLDLDRATRQQTETRRHYEDLLGVHQSDASLFGEARVKLANEEKETERMRKAHDLLEGQLSDAVEALRKIELESNEREKRFQAETHALRGEIQTLNHRVHANTTERIEMAGELAVARTRVADLEAERKTAEKRFAALTVEVESGRRSRFSPGPDREPQRSLSADDYRAAGSSDE